MKNYNMLIQLSVEELHELVEEATEMIRIKTYKPNLKKSAIRNEIERILEQTTDFCYIDSRSNGKYRMKLVMPNILTLINVEKLRALPHVVKVKYAAGNRFFSMSGISITFDCKPSEIKL